MRARVYMNVCAIRNTANIIHGANIISSFTCFFLYFFRHILAILQLCYRNEEMKNLSLLKAITLKQSVIDFACLREPNP